MEEKEKESKPLIPQVKTSMMNMDGDIAINFDVPMMMPETMSTA
jgi:hypothetical protein